MLKVDTTVSPIPMTGALSRSSPGFGPCVAGGGVGVWPVVEFSVDGASLTSVPAQARATRAQTARIPTIKTVRNFQTDNLYLSFVRLDIWESRSAQILSDVVDQRSNIRLPPESHKFGGVQPQSNRWRSYATEVPGTQSAHRFSFHASVRFR